MTNQLTDRDYLRFQYDDATRLRVRSDTHLNYSENPTPWWDWLVRRVDARAGDRLLDVGSGPGRYDAFPGTIVVALDLSFGMLQQTRGAARTKANAEALPFSDRVFDRVLASHMLYHVPDQRAALLEMKRVSADGGRVIVSTNGSDNLAALFGLVNEVADGLGLGEVRGSSKGRFSLDDADLVCSVFPDARLEVREDALVFQATDPVLAYLASGPIDLLSPSQRARLLNAIDLRLKGMLTDNGVLRFAKTAGCFIADL